MEKEFVLDRRKRYLIGMDTETCNGIVVDDKLDLSYSLVYDIGWDICDKQGNVYATRSFVVKEIFLGMFEVMRSAYYAQKIPRYIEDLANGTRILASWYEIREQLINDIIHFNANTVFGHNFCNFDVKAINNTQRYITKSKYRYFFPYGIEIWDTLAMARDTFCKMPTYIEWCKENDYCTKNGKPRATAEILTRFITQSDDFEESHTGLEDVLIETQILAECFKKHKAMRKSYFKY